MMTINYMNDVKVEVEVPTPGLQNLIKNPDGEQGGWGWVTPVTNTTIAKGSAAPNTTLVFTTTVSQASYFQSEMLSVTAGQYAVARFHLVSLFTGHNLKVRFHWYNSSKVFLSSGTQTAAITSAGANFVPAALAPANTAYARVEFYLHNGAGNASTNAYAEIRQVMVAASATSTGFGSTRTNLFVDPQATAVASNWAAWSGNAAGVLQVTGPAWSGTNAMRLTNNSASGYLVVVQNEKNIPVAAGNTYTASAYTYAPSTSRAWQVGIRFFVNGAWMPGYTLGTAGNSPVGTWTRISHSATAPAGATQMRMVLYSDSIWQNEYHYFDGFLVEQSPLLGTYFDGSTAAGGGATYAWTGTTNNSTSTATVASGSFDYQPPYAWLSITGSLNHLSIDREAMNVGMLTAVIKNQDLDPASTNKTLAPGKRVRVQARDGSSWKSLFNGKINNAHVDYNKMKKVNALVDATITITAVDALADLANQGESRSVALVSELPYILEGKGVPWNCNGVTSHISTVPTIPVQNANLSIADQVVLTRDTTRGQAWIDKDGVLQVRDSAGTMPASGITLSDTTGVSYSDIDVDWDTDRIVNSVLVKHLRTSADGQAEEVPYGPYLDAASVSTYGAKQSEYTLVGTINAATYAAAILAANATPTVRANSVRVPIKNAAGLTFATTVDLCQSIAVVFDSKVNTSYRISSVKHTMTLDGWWMELAFDKTTSNAIPQYTPAPPVTEPITDTGWTDLPLVNSWAHFDTSTHGPAAYRRKDGIVYIRGLVTQSVVGQGNFTVAVLPVGFRPAKKVIFATPTGVGIERMDVETSGAITPGGSTGANWKSVHISYVADG